jgi:hypothetical protein
MLVHDHSICNPYLLCMRLSIHPPFASKAIEGKQKTPLSILSRTFRLFGGDYHEAPSIDNLLNFFSARLQVEEKSHSHINIGVFAPMHQFLAKIVVTNFWLQARRSELNLKKATLLYAIVMRTPFYLSKHILHTMLEVHDETNTNLSFECLITQICLQLVTNISDSEPRSRISDPLEKQT